MALYHLSVKQIKRSAGQSAVAAAAYRAGEKLHSDYYGEDADYTKKGGVVFTEILLPSHAPREYADRETLWNAVEKIEEHPKAQLAYSFDIALQNEFSMEENISLAMQFVEEQFVSRGMIADLAVHTPDKENGENPNPHFHVLCPIRPLNEDSTWGKKQRREYVLDEHGNRIPDGDDDYVFKAVPTTDWGRPETLENWREEWAKLCNAKFMEKGYHAKIDHRSFERQGVDKLPTVHEGPHVRQMEARGILTERGDLNRWIRQTNQLKVDKVLTPTVYKKRQGRKTPHAEPENPYDWQDSSVVNILERREYTGCTVNFKTYSNSIWDKKQRENPIEKQAIFENTHEAIITGEVFKRVQEIRQQRHRKTRSGRSSMFSGLVFCSDCGSKLYYGATNNYKPEGAFFDCSLHWKRKDKCATHYIRESVLERMVLRHMQIVTGYILRYEEHFRSVMDDHLRLDSTEKLEISKGQLERNEKRIAELKQLFIRIYEDNARGKLADDRYDMMSQSYDAEQKKLEAEVIALRQEIEVQERQNDNVEKFIEKAKRYVGIDKLDPYALRELVQEIYVDAPDKSGGKRQQTIHIRYDGIGLIPLEELMKKAAA